ncbi:MAG: sigma-70 family RNA polymerase sigma factor [Phycisphaerae bacterium]|nr:sigma-70 family RNA polymerase sigma factor [Phycisphaerae bacterium]
MNEASEIALVRQAQRGDADAFSDLVRMYQRRAVSLAYRLLGNAEDAADVAQDAFVRAFRHLDQLADPGRFGPWLLRTVSNLSLNFRRSRASRAAMSLEDEAQLPDGARPTGRASGEASDAADLGPLPAELQSAVTQAVAQLPEKQRLSLILFSVEGMPQKEVAEVLECSIELVKWNVFQARKKLKELLAAHL